MLNPAKSRRQLGSSLLEVLVSIVIASIGLLGLAGINAAAVRYGKLSQYRAIATLLASDITERMRVNSLNATALASYQFTTDYAGQQGAIAAVSPNCESLASSCDAAQMATADLVAWRRSVKSSLEGGSVRLVRDATTGAFDLWIIWTDAGNEHIRSGGDDKECPSGLNLTAANSNVRCMYFRLLI